MRIRIIVRLICFVGASTVALSCCAFQAAGAVDDPFLDAGIRYYQKRDWRSAIYYLEQQVKKAPWDSKAMYYLALSYHSAGYKSKAKAMYQQIVDKYPGSAVFQNANIALKALNAELKKEADTAARTANRPTAAAGVSAPSAGATRTTGVVNIVTNYAKASGQQGKATGGKKSGR